MRFGEYLFYAAGEFMSSSEKLRVNCSWDNELIAETYYADNSILEICIEKAQKALNELKIIPLFKKSMILKQISDSIKDNIERLTEILSYEACKPYVYARAEVDRAAQTFYVASEECKRIPGEYMRLDWHPAANNKEAIVKYFPVGLVAGISPFNFPLNLVAHKVAPAIAAGCPIILKPASATPLSSLELAKIIDQTELPKGTFSVLPMKRTVGNLLVTDERFKLLSFTGSSEVGWQMKNMCGKKKVVLELGGNAAAVVTPSADYEWALKQCITGAFAYQGQICIHTQRIFVHESLYEKFYRDFVDIALTLKKGHPYSKDTLITSMIDEENAIRIEEWVKEAITQGAKVLCGGKRNYTFFEPTVLISTTPEMKVNKLETFAPTVTIEPYSSFKEAIAMVNNTNYGLQAGVFTNDMREVNYAFDEIETGGVIINDIPTFRADHMPYGGIKDSGLGREGVKYAILDMMEPKILVKNIK